MTAIVAVGCLVGATLAIGIAAVAAPRTRAPAPVDPVAVRLDARILAADGTLVSAPSIIAFVGDHAEFSAEDERLGMRVETAKHHTFLLELDHHHQRDRATARARVHEGQRATFHGADGMTVEVTPHIVQR